MAISGSNTGNPGGIPEFSLNTDQNAAAQVLRTAMGIIKNLDTISFTDVGKKPLWKYESSPSKPTLHPLEHLRADTSPSRIDDSWKELMQTLINDLPENVRVAYERNLLLPLENRNASLIALGRILEGTAKTIHWINNSAKAVETQKPVEEIGTQTDARITNNVEWAKAIMTGIMRDSQIIFQLVRNELLKFGPNDQHFDGLVGVLNKVGLAYKSILNVNNPENTAD